jgi:hypothetical protein
MYWGEMQAVVENIINGKRESTSLLNRFLRLFGRNSISVSVIPSPAFHIKQTDYTYFSSYLSKSIT